MTTSTKLRQAAAILNVIPSDKADLILDRLPTRDLRCLVRAMRELDSLAEGQLFEALELFARDITQQAIHSQPAHRKLDVDEMLTLDPLAESTRYSHFGFLTDLSANQVGTLLSDEHPKTIATVLSMLPPDFASDVLTALDPVIRVSALKRVCDDRSATTHELDALHVALRKRVAKLTATPASERELQFEDLTCLTDRQWQVLLRYTNTACWAPALKTAPRGLRERVLNNLALEPRRLLRREIEELLDLTSEQIALARAAILETCKTLCDGGKLDVRPY